MNYAEQRAREAEPHYWAWRDQFGIPFNSFGAYKLSHAKILEMQQAAIAPLALTKLLNQPRVQFESALVALKDELKRRRGEV